MQAAAIRGRNVNPLVLTLINLHTGVQRDSAALTPPRQRRKSALSADMRQCMSPIPDNLRILGTSLKTEANAEASQPFETTSLAHHFPDMRRPLTTYLPDWTLDWLEIIIPGVQIFLILLGAWLLQYMLRRLVNRLDKHYQLPPELTMTLKGLLRWTLMMAAMMMVLERMGVSATVLWTAFTGFATVGAVAFFAAWSVLSNLFCAFLIFTARPFRLGDGIELMDAADKPGPRGRVVDINLLYTTLEEADSATAGTLLQIPNALIFQRVLRRWRGGIAMPVRSVTPVPPVTETPETREPEPAQTLSR